MSLLLLMLCDDTSLFTIVKHASRLTRNQVLAIQKLILVILIGFSARLFYSCNMSTSGLPDVSIRGPRIHMYLLFTDFICHLLHCGLG